MGKTRPNLNAWFRGRIDWHVNGMLARTVNKPNDLQIKGDVTDRLITVTERDGTEWYWEGGKYAARKINGCYAPLMPKPLKQRPPYVPEVDDHIRTTGPLKIDDGRPDPSDPGVGSTGQVTWVNRLPDGRFQIAVTWDPPNERLKLMLIDTDPFEVIP